MDKLAQLRHHLRSLSSSGVALAFSGGVDSSLLLHLLREISEETACQLIALYVHSTMHPSRDLHFVQKQAGCTPLHIEQVEALDIAEVRANAKLRCYHCKKSIFTLLIERAKKAGCDTLIDGTNADDLLVYRPGKQAIRELGVRSPLAELSISKSDVRAMAAQLGLETASRPSAPCLATRFDYETQLNSMELRRVETGENYLREMLGQETNLRLRVHLPQLLARIEVEAGMMPFILERREEIADKLRELGYKQISLDLLGFRSGSMDE